MFRGIRIKSCWPKNGYIIHRNMSFFQSIHNHMLPHIGIKPHLNFFLQKLLQSSRQILKIGLLRLVLLSNTCSLQCQFLQCVLPSHQCVNSKHCMVSVWTFKCVKIARCKKKQKPLCAKLSIVCENYKIRKVTWNNNKKW
jgi:hypothetical protein